MEFGSEFLLEVRIFGFFTFESYVFELCNLVFSSDRYAYLIPAIWQVRVRFFRQRVKKFLSRYHRIVVTSFLDYAHIVKQLDSVARLYDIVQRAIALDSQM